MADCDQGCNPVQGEAGAPGFLRCANVKTLFSLSEIVSLKLSQQTFIWNLEGPTLGLCGVCSGLTFLTKALWFSPLGKSHCPDCVAAFPTVSAEAGQVNRPTIARARLAPTNQAAVKSTRCRTRFISADELATVHLDNCGSGWAG